MALKFRGESLYSWYSVLVFMACYAVGELGHFLVGITSKSMAEEIHFGDIGCTGNTSVKLTEDQKIECNSIKNYSVCLLEELNETFYCKWDYIGSGVEYQLLAGPAFIAIFTVMGLILGVFGDTYNRVRLLFGCVLIFSSAILLMGFATKYWQLVLLRFLFGAGEAGCTPLTASIVADTFNQGARGLAMSVYNWGIYLGYGSAFAVGNFVTEADINNQGWRWSYFLSAIPGFVFSVLLIITVKEIRGTQTTLHTNENDDETNKPLQDDQITTEGDNEENIELSFMARLSKALKFIFTRPSIITLLCAASIRHTASFCWAYNTQLYFKHYFPDTNLGLWMTLTSIIGGSFGIASGGLISDLVVKRYGIRMRLWVLIVSQAIASPFAAGVLYFSPPYCFVSLLIAYIFAEMWYGVAMAVVVESVPSYICGTTMGIFSFIISNIGGNLPVVIEPVAALIGLRATLYIFYAGFYLLSSLLFLFTQILIGRERSEQRSEISTIETRSNDPTDNKEVLLN